MENSRDVFSFGQRISEPIDQSETRTTVGFRISTHEVEEGFFSRLRIKMATGLGSGVEESGDSTEDLLFDWRGKRGVAGNDRLPL